MASARRQLILEALRDRLALITVEHGFNTDAGATLFTGETPELGEGDPEVAIALLVRDEEPQFQGENILTRLPIEIQALAKADLNDPYLVAEQILGDIKRAVELDDRTLGGLVRRQLERGVTRTLTRQPGSVTVGVGVLYVAPYVEKWGHP